MLILMNLEKQAIDRVHRIGQQASHVTITRITIPDTIEDRILDLQKIKQNLANEALGENIPGQEGRQSMRSLSRNDLLYLFTGKSRQ